MGIEELAKVPPVDEVVVGIVRKRPVTPGGYEDPACEMFEGQTPEDGSASQVLVAMTPDNMISRRRLGTLQIEAASDGEAHMVVAAEDQLGENPALLGKVVEMSLRHADVPSAIVRPETDTNLSGKVLAMAGATALGGGEAYQFSLPAAA